MKAEIDAGIRAYAEAIENTDEQEKPRILSGFNASRNTLIELRNFIKGKEEEAGIEEDFI